MGMFLCFYRKISDCSCNIYYYKNLNYKASLYACKQRLGEGNEIYFYNMHDQMTLTFGFKISEGEVIMLDYYDHGKYCWQVDESRLEIVESLKEGLPLLNKKLNGFAKDENLLVAIESRSSCPLTIVRNEGFESNIKIWLCCRRSGA